MVQWFGFHAFTAEGWETKIWAHSESRRILSQDPQLDIICERPYVQIGPIHRYWGLALGHVFGGNTIRPATESKKQMHMFWPFFPRVSSPLGCLLSLCSVS